MGRLSLKVVPGSSRDDIVGWLGDSLKVKVKVKVPPLKGGMIQHGTENRQEKSVICGSIMDGTARNTVHLQMD